MKSILKSIGRAAWRATGPIRRPVARKLSAFFAASIRPPLDDAMAEVARIRVQVEVEGRAASESREETGLILDALLREITRLQDQVEELRGAEGSRREPRTEFRGGSNAA